MRRDGSPGIEVRDRLGLYRIGERRAIEAIAELVDGERLDAVGAGIWKRRGWLVAASGGGLRLVRRPRVFGRPRDERFQWADLTAVRCSDRGAGVTLTFGERDLELYTLLPAREFARLLDTARRHLAGGEASVTVEALHTLALRELGRWKTLELETSIADVPDRLEPGERLECVAAATLNCNGLLVVTDRRVLVSAPASLKRQDVWSVARSDIRSAAAVETGLWLDTGDATVTLTRIIPAERRFELADLLASDADLEDGVAAFRGPLLPERRWELTAAESHFLRYFDCDVDAVEIFKLALLELIARQALRLEGAWVPRRWGPGRRFVWLVVDGPRLYDVDAPALASILALYDATWKRRLRVGLAHRDPTQEVSGVLVTDLAVGGFGIALGDLGRDVAASLEERELLSSTRMERTAAGERADRQLDLWLRLGATELPARAGDHDLSWVRAYLRGAGAAVLLADPAYPALAQVGRRDAGGWLDVTCAALAELDLALGVVDAGFPRL